MANGTIAFDTLSTSGQISGTAKSVDTDYIVSSSAKHFIVYKSVSGTAILNSQSFNSASITDNGTGDTTFSLTNNMAQARYAIPDSGGNTGEGYSTFTREADSTTSSYVYITGNDNFGAQDTDFHSCSTIGDLA